jgi:Flp pilus assembly protein TadD
VELKPDLADACSNLGTAFMMQGKTNEAVVHIRKAVELDGDNSNTLCKLGMAMYNLDRFQEAVGHLSKAVRLGACRNTRVLVGYFR